MCKRSFLSPSSCGGREAHSHVTSVKDPGVYGKKIQKQHSVSLLKISISVKVSGLHLCNNVFVTVFHCVIHVGWSLISVRCARIRGTLRNHTSLFEILNHKDHLEGRKGGRREERLCYSHFNHLFQHDWKSNPVTKERGWHTEQGHLAQPSVHGSLHKRGVHPSNRKCLCVCPAAIQSIRGRRTVADPQNKGWDRPVS